MFRNNPNQLTFGDVEKLRQINIHLVTIIPSESTKIKIELLYFDLLDLLKAHGSTSEFECSIKNLKNLHAMMINRLTANRKTVRNIVSAIRTFKNSMRIILRELIRSGPVKNS